MKIGPKYKICRRLGDRVFSKCQTTKFTVSGTNKKKVGRPRKAMSEYGSQLLEKQKVRYTYGVNEKQFSNYVKDIRKKKDGSPTSHLYQALELRLDNTVYRMGLVNSRIFARQIVSHGHIMVNGRKVTIPSYKVKPGDKISIRPQSKDKKLFDWFRETSKDYNPPAWLSMDEQGEAIVKSIPEWDDSTTLNFGSILEFYSRV